MPIPWNQQEPYKSLPLSFLFYLPLSESYYIKVEIVIYDDYERIWPFNIKWDIRNSGQTVDPWVRMMTKILRAGQDLKGHSLQSCPVPLQTVSPEYFHTLQFVLQNSQVAFVKYDIVCMTLHMPARFLRQIKADMPCSWLLLPGTAFL